MLRACIFAVVVSSCHFLFATEPSLVFSEYRQWDGLPRKIEKDARSYELSDVCFSGRWGVAEIESRFLPKLTDKMKWRQRIKDEQPRFEALVVFDTKTDQCFCINIRDTTRNKSHYNSAMLFESQDILYLCTTGPEAKDCQDHHEFRISLPDKSYRHNVTSGISARNHIESIRLGVHSLRDVIPDADMLCNKKSDTSSCLTPYYYAGWHMPLQIEFEGIPKERHRLGRGTRRDRIMQCDIVIPGKFSVSERDASRDGRTLWILGEKAFAHFITGGVRKFNDIYFPTNRSLSSDRVIFCVNASLPGQGEIWKMFAVVDGRVSPLWENRECEILYGFVLSDNGHVAAVRYTTASDDKMIAIDTLTGEVQKLCESPEVEMKDTALIGITNGGDIIAAKSNFTEVILETPSGNSKELIHPIRTDYDSEYSTVIPDHTEF